MSYKAKAFDVHLSSIAIPEVAIVIVRRVPS